MLRKFIILSTLHRKMQGMIPSYTPHVRSCTILLAKGFNEEFHIIITNGFLKEKE
jgi:hypothetical protein